MNIILLSFLFLIVSTSSIAAAQSSGETAEIWAHCDGNLTVKQRDGLLKIIHPWNIIGQTDEWETPFHAVVPVSKLTELKFECSNNGVIGGFIATINHQGIDYSTIDPMSESVFTVVKGQGLFKKTKLKYHDKTAAPWSIHTPGIADNAKWIWNEANNAMVFEFSFKGLPQSPSSDEGAKTCQFGSRQKGFCVTSNGNDQNDGVIKKNSIDGNSPNAQSDCLDICSTEEGVTGAEVIWNQSNRGCYCHTQPIARGNGKDNHYCFICSPPPSPNEEHIDESAEIYAHCDNALKVKQRDGNGDWKTIGAQNGWQTPYHAVVKVSELTKLSFECTGKDDISFEDLAKLPSNQLPARFKVQSVNHKYRNSYGKYFNFYIRDVDAILGRTNWDGDVFSVWVKRKDKFFKTQVKIWRDSHGGKIGDGHGRRNHGDKKNQWQVGDEIMFEISSKNNGGVGGFIASIHYKGSTYSTVEPSLTSQNMFEIVKGGTKDIEYHDKTALPWKIDTKGIADNAQWIWNEQSTNAMTFEFSFDDLKKPNDESAQVYARCDNKLTVKQRDLDGEWKTVGKIGERFDGSISVSKLTEIRFECEGISRDGGFISTIHYKGNTYSTIEPMSDSFFHIVKGVTDEDDLDYEGRTHGPVKIGKKGIAKDAKWVWSDDKTKAMTFEFSFHGLDQLPPSFEVYSINHKHRHSHGKYFNFYMKDVDAIMGRTDWSGDVYRVWVERDGAMFQDEVRMWRDRNGGDVGDAHGRREHHIHTDQWQIGDKIMFPKGDDGLRYDHSIGNEAWYYANGALCPKVAQKLWKKHKGLGDGPKSVKKFEFIKRIDSDSATCYIGYDHGKDRIVISFAANDGLFKMKDRMETNTDWEPMKYPNARNAKVFSGFYKAWKELEKAGLGKEIKDALKGQSWWDKLWHKKPEYEDFFLTGHGMGGAIAGIAAMELKLSPEYRGYKTAKVDVVTFGSPRWCNKEMAETFDKVINSNWRIVNRYDTVATVPFKKMGYSHVGTEVWYNYEKWVWNKDPTAYRICDGSGEDSKCFGTDYWWDRFDPLIDDHHTSYFDLNPKKLCSAGVPREIINKAKKACFLCHFKRFPMPNAQLDIAMDVLCKVCRK